MAVELYDEHEQGERVRKWIREYGVSVVTGLVLAFGGIFGFRYWQDQQAEQKLLAANLFNVIETEIRTGDASVASARFDELRNTAPRSAYVGLAGLLLASSHVEDGRLQAAAEIYRDLLNERRMETLWPLVRLRLARVLEAQGDAAQALSVLDAVPTPAGHEAAWAELRGDLLLALGRRSDALAAFEQALQLSDEFGFGRMMLQMKIDSAGPDASGSSS